MSKPSKRPAVVPSGSNDVWVELVAGKPSSLLYPPTTPGSPLMNMLIHDETNAWRADGVEAACEKKAEPLYPPSDMITFRSGYLAFNSENCWKLPRSPFVPVFGSACPLAPVIGVRPGVW